MEFTQKEIVAIRNALLFYRIENPFKEEYKKFLDELETRFLMKIETGEQV